MDNIKLKLSDDFFKEEVRNDYTVSPEMKRIWAVELDLLDQLDRVCQKYDIPWYLSGGSLLGAVRHKGYIPWDDDIDLMMYRKDFDRLCEVAKDEFAEPYFFQTEETDPGAMRGHAQLRNSMTTAILKSEQNFHYQFNQGIFIDIFPLDNVPDDPEERQAFVKNVNQLKHRARQFYNYCNGYPNKNLSGLKKFLLYSKFFFEKKKSGGRNIYYDRFAKEITKYDDQDTQEVMMVMLETEKCCWKREYVANPVRVPFEMLSLPIPKDYDPLLTKQYGKWNVFVRGGSIHGSVIFDPDKSYKEYLK